MFTQAPPQSTVGGVQGASTQMPLLHVWPEAQALPHAPQLVGSLVRSSHPLAQSDSGGMQGEKQVPRLQISPGPQRTPQAPQLAGSMRVSVQLAPQALSGRVQAATHPPNWQS